MPPLLPSSHSQSLLGEPIPAHTPHAVSVSMPRWQDNVDYEEQNPRVVDVLQAGYPRFVFHPAVQKLCRWTVEEHLRSKLLLQQDSAHATSPCDSLECLLFPAEAIGLRCQAYIQQHANSGVSTDVFAIPVDARLTLSAVVFPRTAQAVAKQFWQHTGEGISSRAAEYAWNVLVVRSAAGQPLSAPSTGEDAAVSDWGTYVEERYGRNMHDTQGNATKLELRHRLADCFFVASAPSASGGASPRSTPDISHVYLYPCGMSAIYNAHRILRQVLGADRKSIQFGFPYTDTLKVLQRFGSGCVFYARGDSRDLDALQTTLEQQQQRPEAPRILALFCEFPSNPLLRSPDLPRLRALADRYGFAIVIDETLGNPCNVSVLPFADVVVSSLTKIFSGDCNVMGGCLLVNPSSVYRDRIQAYMNTPSGYTDTYWHEDAIFLERNSRTFQERIATINANAEQLCDFLYAHPKVKLLHYPKYNDLEDRERYQQCRRQTSGCYGGLFSLVLKPCQSNNKVNTAEQFFDALDVCKGPSLGTNFTLACPYTILAHYSELEFAEECGVSQYLIRVSVGLENVRELMHKFQLALDAVTL